MRVILLLLLICTAAIGSEPAPSRCVTCEGVLPEKFYWFEGPALEGKQAVCESCAKFDSRCAICRLPVGNPKGKLADGRWLCPKDFQAGVFSSQDALRIYEETRRELQEILAGTGIFPKAVTVSLVDGAQLRKQNQVMPSAHEDASVLGLTRSRLFGPGEFQHSICLVNGLSRARLAAVCAHEYTHAWIHENVPRDRALNRDTVEGFCELVAYKLMTRRKEEIEKKVILANAYTRGQVNAFVQAETAQHFHRIVQWVKTGVDASIPQTNEGPDLGAQDRTPAVVVWPPPLPKPTTVPDTLMLKGISGRRPGGFVLVNDTTLTKNEEGRVRLGSSNLLVRCIEIRNRSAILQVKGFSQPIELFLGAK